MADDDLQKRIERLGSHSGDSDPPESEGDRPSQLTIKFDAGKGKIKWGRTIAASILAASSIAEVVVELVSKDGVISQIVKLFEKFGLH